MAPINETLVREFLEHADGFHHANWERVWAWIESNRDEAERESAWNEVAKGWLTILRDDLGGKYKLLESPFSFVLIEAEAALGERMHGFVDRTIRQIDETLPGVAWAGAFGKRTVLFFGEDDDYYQFISHFSQEGEQALSGGLSIGGMFAHVAILASGPDAPEGTVIHELAHDSVSHLSLPNWLDEGVALSMEQLLCFTRPPGIDPELTSRHFEFWDQQKIQFFWSGLGFYVPGDMSELCYSLAEVLFTLLMQDFPNEAVRNFLETVQSEDEGEEAALKALKSGLGKIAQTFLGPGDWKPDQRMVKELWERGLSKETGIDPAGE